MSSNDKPPIPLKIGTKVACYWPDDDYWYKGTVAKQLGGDRYWIKYDDGGEGEMNIKEDKWRFSVDPNPAEMEKRATIAALEPGSRITVYFPHEQKYYSGTLTKKQDDGPHHIEYDDGDKEWTNLLFRKFQKIPEKASLAQSGSHVTVDDDESRARNDFLVPVVKIEPENVRSQEVKQEDQDGTMVKIEPDNVRSHEVKHEQETKKECSNLHSDSTADVKVERGEKRRKEEFEDTEHPQKKQKRPQKNLEVAEEENLEGSSASTAQSKQGTSEARKPVNKAFAVEQVDLETGETISTYPSMRKAQEATGVFRLVIKRVLERRGKANGGGYFWRYQGETHGAWPDPRDQRLKPVEQLDWETGDVLETYVSLAEAKRKMCMDPKRPCIQRVCDGLGFKERADGYFWRWKGSDSLPSHLMGESEARGPGTSRVLEIRKERNGKVEKVFKNSSEARAFLDNQCSEDTIRKRCQANDFFLGYYWRYRSVARRRDSPEAKIGRRLKVKQAKNEWFEGEIKSFCSHSGMHEILFDCGRTEQRCLEDVEYEWQNDKGQKSVEQLDLQTGQILASFDSISDANRILGLSSRQVSHVCNGRQRSAFGYFWRFKGSKELPREKKCPGVTKVDQLCLKTGQVIATFDKILDATNALGISGQSIGKCCNGRRGYKSAGGFGWRFSKEDDGDCDVE